MKLAKNPQMGYNPLGEIMKYILTLLTFISLSCFAEVVTYEKCTRGSENPIIQKYCKCTVRVLKDKDPKNLTQKEITKWLKECVAPLIDKWEEDMKRD